MSQALEAGRQPFMVHCRDCQHEWAAFYLPLTLDANGKRLMNSAGKSPCPMCAGRNVFVGSIAVSLKRIADVMERYAASELPPAIKEGKDNG